MYTRNVLRNALYYSEKFNIPVADAIQDGIVGLIMAIDKYDQADSEKFQTYFPIWVQQVIRRSMSHYMYAAYFPAHTHEMLMTIRVLASQLGIDFPIESTDADELLSAICERLNCTESKARDLLKYLAPPESFESIIEAENESDDGTGVLFDSSFEDEMIDMIMKKDARNVILRCMETLSSRGAKVLAMRYGLSGDSPKTLEEIGQVLGVTRERVRQIEEKELRRLRHPSRSKILKGYF